MPPKTRKTRNGLPPSKTISIPQKPSDDRPSSNGSVNQDQLHHHSTNSFAILNSNEINDDESHQVKNPPSFPHANSRSQTTGTSDDQPKPSSATSFTSIDNYMTSYASVTKKNIEQPSDSQPSLDDRFHSVLQMIQMQQTQMNNSDSANKLRYDQLDSTTSFISNQLKHQTESTNAILQQLGTQNNALSGLITSSKHPSVTSHMNKDQSCLQPSSFPKVEQNNHDNSVTSPHDCPTDSRFHKPTTENTTSSTSDPSIPTNQPHKLTNQNFSTSNIFGSNEFALACSSKIKFSEIESSLKTKKLKDDSDLQMERFYSGIIRSVCYAFESGLNIVPSFLDLNPDINFEEIFLHDLVGSNFFKCRQVFNRIGEIIKDRMVSNDCISHDCCPKAFIVIKANPVLTGWELLEKLLCA
jgi:hypothetical protein